MKRPTRILLSLAMVGVGTFTLGFGLSAISDPLPPDTTYRPLPTRPLSAVRADDEAQKAQVMARQSELLNQRYDSVKPAASGVMMSGGRKPVQGGVRVKLPQGATWDGLAADVSGGRQATGTAACRISAAAPCEARDRRTGFSRAAD